ncbi:MAG: EAL domain-containing protein [Actinobacteria bacterium]|nr:MAG: EAL domain-containing protein [Actinomycetota bacterium]TMK66499.1 MAG: EAL domain-containing protein [Actinomycetota bacterium]
MRTMDRIRVLIADDEESVLDVLTALMAAESDLEIAGSAKDAETAIQLATVEQPDVAILDVRMPGGGGPRAAREILRRSPASKIIALSAHEEVDSVLEMLRAGALGYVVKGDSTDAIVKAIHRSLDQQGTFSSQVTGDMAHALAEQLHMVSQGAKQRRQELEDRIGRVLDGDGHELYMAYQPIFDLKDSSVVGVEALARFTSPPDRSTDTWLAEAEAVGRLLELELACLRTALRDLDRLPEETYLSLNVSPATAIAPELHEVLDGLPAERVVLEMTEHARVDDYPALKAALAVFRERGFRLAIDDAGAGFASLRHIVLLHPDFIKLDMTLTRDVHVDATRRALVVALVAFGSQIGARVVAEGVETPEQLATLLEAGVHFGQGFYLARPQALPDDANSWSSGELILADTRVEGSSQERAAI